MTRWDKAPEVPKLKVITQYWRGRERVCELEKSGNVLDLRISRAEEALDGAAVAGWHVRAQSGHAETAHVFSESGSTRSAALSAVASAWVERAPALGLPTFDWEAVAVALRAVNAVE